MSAAEGKGLLQRDVGKRLTYLPHIGQEGKGNKKTLEVCCRHTHKHTKNETWVNIE